MAKSNDNQQSPDRTIAELVELFDSTDLGDMIDQTEVRAEVHLTGSRHLFEIEDDVVAQLEETARERKVSAQVLINTILRDKLAEAS
jgi:predicted DNA-binding ribbon-helix-helix protein